MENEVLDFIKNFQNEGTIKTFTEGCCYWFAHILHDRFATLWDDDNVVVIYNPILNHFATMIDGNMYDITGCLGKYNDEWYYWSVYRNVDWLDYKRVREQCILKK